MTRLLIVDDSPVMRRLVRRALPPYCEVVGEAGDGYNLVALVERLRPHVVIMDFQMPTVSGVEATRTVKQHFPEMVVVGFTSAESEIRQRMKAAGAEAVFGKDELIQLASFVGETVGSRRGAQANSSAVSAPAEDLPA